MALTYAVKNEMLKGVKDTLTSIKLLFQDGTKSSAVTTPGLWKEPSLGAITQNTNVVFAIDPGVDVKNVSGFEFLFGTTLGLEASTEQIYNYPNEGSFTFSETKIVVE